jgi:hypothetical protein
MMSWMKSRNSSDSHTLSGLIQWQVSCALAATLIIGCGPTERIESYSTAKPETLQTVAPTELMTEVPGEPQQMLVAMTVIDNAAWFFKLMGSPERVTPHEMRFDEFVRSVTFDGPDGAPQWQVPDGWTTGSASGIRFATLILDTKLPPLELTVTRLEKSIANDDEYLLSNMNRWREQLQLSGFADVGAVQSGTKLVEAGGHKFYVANFTGTGSAPGGGMGLGPFAGGAPHPPFADPAIGAAGTAKPVTGLKYDVPENWQELPGSPPFSYAKFTVARDGKQLDVSVSTAGGSLLANVNRWRDQIGLPPFTDEQLTAALMEVQLGAVPGQLVELTNSDSQETILGVIAEHAGQTWFVKLRGDAQLAQAEKPQFLALVNSIQLP